MVLTTPWHGHGAAAPDRQILVIGDVHGRAGALERMLGHLAALPARGGGRDLVFLGDLIDRGPESLRAVRLAWGSRDLADRVLPLPGNHELMDTSCLPRRGYRCGADGIPYTSGVSEPVFRRGSRPPPRSSS